MNIRLGVLAIATLAAGGAHAASLTPALQPLGFLVGQWEGEGAVSDTGGRAHGVSSITVEADGRVLLRKDRNEGVDRAGKPTQGFGQLMMIYPEAGGVRADYADGEGHVIHYGPAVIVAGKSVEFTSIAPPGAPVFRLLYEAEGADALKISFTFRPPGQAGFQPIAIGEVHRVR